MSNSTIHSKLAEIQRTLKAPKNQENKFGKYKYRSCEDILEAVKPLLSDCTLIVSDKMIMLGDRFYIEATAKISDGKDYVEATAYAREALEQKGMAEAQLTGSTSSYARKYALNGLLLIDDNKDADTQDNREKREQVNPEPINQAKVESAVTFFKAQIDIDAIEETHQKVKAHAKTLTNDEKIAVADLMNDKPEGCGKMYRNILKEYINYKPVFFDANLLDGDK